MDSDRAILSSALVSGQISTLLARGIEVRHFSNTRSGEECKGVFNYCSKHVRKYGASPSPQLVKSNFPDWRGESSSDPLEALIDQFLNDVRRRFFAAKVLELAQAEGNPANWGKLDEIMLDAARDLATVIPSGQVSRVRAEMNERIDQYEVDVAEGKKLGIMCGISLFDDLTDGFQRGDIVTVAGFSGRGKSMLSQFFLSQAIDQGKDALLMSLEMSKRQIMDRFDTMVTNFSHKQLRKRELPSEELENWRLAAKKYEDAKNDLIVIDTPGNCVSGDTLVQTKNGIEIARDLDGKMVDILISGGKYSPAFWKSYGEQSLYKITLENEDVIYATKEHKWLVVRKTPSGPNGNRKTKEFINTDNLVNRRIVVQSTNEFDYNEKDYIEGVRNGLIYGDGCENYDKLDDGSYTVSSSFDQFGDSGKELMERFFDHWSEHGETKNGIKGYRSGRYPRYYKKLPTSDKSPSWMRGFVAGLIAADGSCDENGSVQIHSSKKNDLETIRYIAGSCGIATMGLKMGRERSPFDRSYAPIYRLSFVKSSFFLEGEFDKKLLLKSNHVENFENSNQNERLNSILVISVEKTDRIEKVYCCEEPTTHTWTLGNGLVSSNCTVDRIYAEINRYKPDITCVDYVQLMKGSKTSAAKHEGLIEITNELKGVALATDSTIIMVSQDQRNSAEDGSTESNMGGSVSVYQAADIYIGMMQNQVMREQKKLNTRLIKNRNGAPGEQDVMCDPEYMIFKPWVNTESFEKEAV